jgi:hypothetical protein
MRPGVPLSAVLGALLVAATPLPAAQIRTQNFVVEAPTAEAARQFGERAEFFRRQKAVEWLGQEMPPWPQPCPLTVKVTMSGAGGATTFQFTGGNVSQTMQIEGSYERLLNSVLPHEVTHTVFAHRFRRPVPRWADEGGSVLSEDEPERARHDGLCRQMLNAGRAMPLSYLFKLTEYPQDVMVLYAQGFSVCRFLVDLQGRQNFLNFIATGMQSGWDAAARNYYGFNDVKEMETAWIESLRRPRGELLASRNGGRGAAAGGELTNRLRVRDTAPPAVPELDAPLVVRGQSPALDEPAAPPTPRKNRPGYLPEVPATMPPARTGPAARRSASGAMPAPVLLGRPEVD